MADDRQVPRLDGDGEGGEAVRYALAFAVALAIALAIMPLVRPKFSRGIIWVMAAIMAGIRRLPKAPLMNTAR